MSNIGIIDYGMGNLRSVFNAVDFLGFDCELVQNPEDINKYSRLILPGVGAYARAMENLVERKFVEPLNSYVDSGKPLLGICLGMHLLSTLGFEPVETAGLDYIGGDVKLMPVEPHVAVPHVGWNDILFQYEHPLFKGCRVGADYYFVHSYCFQATDSADVLGVTEYEGYSFASAVAKNNVVGLQFHPEKSQMSGLRILENFCEWDGRC